MTWFSPPPIKTVSTDPDNSTILVEQANNYDAVKSKARVFICIERHDEDTHPEHYVYLTENQAMELIGNIINAVIATKADLLARGHDAG